MSHASCLTDRGTFSVLNGQFGPDQHDMEILLNFVLLLGGAFSDTPLFFGSAENFLRFWSTKGLNSDFGTAQNHLAG